MTPTPRSLLVVLAHPDDKSFPMGGTLAKYAAEGRLTCHEYFTLARPVEGQADLTDLFELTPVLVTI